jgi:predicted hotdog family 3-hydroxylacyl-ACP dehydratase
MNTAPSLPLSADLLVPHKPPILVIDRLIEFNDLQGVVESCIQPDSIFVREDGSVDEVTMVEIIAQSFAAVKGYADLLKGKPVSRGFLVGVKRLRITGTAFGGERLLTYLTRIGDTEEFSLAEGKVMHNDQLIASGNVMVWVPKDTP